MTTSLVITGPRRKVLRYTGIIPYAVPYIPVAHFYNWKFAPLNPLQLLWFPTPLPLSNHSFVLCIHESVFILFCFLGPTLSEIIWYLSFSDWLISLSIRLEGGTFKKYLEDRRNQWLTMGSERWEWVKETFRFPAWGVQLYKMDYIAKGAGLLGGKICSLDIMTITCGTYTSLNLRGRYGVGRNP